MLRLYRANVDIRAVALLVKAPDGAAQAPTMRAEKDAPR